jgi:hypothetical protein
MVALLLAVLVGAFPGHAYNRAGQEPRRPDLKTYRSAGPGHAIQSIGEGGKTVMLEDGSVWAVDARTQFKVAGWEAGAQISVHLTVEDPDFNYILNNEDVDDWTFATLVSQK